MEVKHTLLHGEVQMLEWRQFGVTVECGRYTLLVQFSKLGFSSLISVHLSGQHELHVMNKDDLSLISVYCFCV